MEAFFFAVIILGMYLMPTIIAASRKHAAPGPVFLVNLFLGWTVLFWVVALIWAASGRTQADDELRRLQIEALKQRQGGGA